jgi:glucose/arabinose dehydrogenase
VHRPYLLLVMAAFLVACTTPASSPPGPEAFAPDASMSSATAALPATATSAAPAPTSTPASLRAVAFPDATAYSWVSIATGLDSPVDVQFPDDGSGRMFIVEQVGRIRIVENGQVLGNAYLDISPEVGSQGNEQGLLGLAFHPDFKDHPFFYVNYTDGSGNTVIARFQATGDAADRASKKVLLRIDQPFPNHNGGGMTFGPDGDLYLGLGDGGSSGDPFGNAQNTRVLLGKILRVDVDHGDPYSIPPGNPFARGGGRPEIWAYGLRNPWRFSFDRMTGDLYIGDVGQDLWEEVDVAPGNSPGLNYGWNYFEGVHPYAGQAPGGFNVTMPVAEYGHSDGGCAVIGGYVYAGQIAPWRGIYLYGDECSGNIWGLIPPPGTAKAAAWQSQLLFNSGTTITCFGQDPQGEVYMAGRSGTIYRLSQ